MNTDFDFIIVGSGPAGVSAAYPLVSAGLRVLIIDGGKSPKIKTNTRNYLNVRYSDESQLNWMVGKNYYSLKNRDNASPKIRVPQFEYVFEDFQLVNKIVSADISIVGSLAKGGLSNAWGCGVAQLTKDEFDTFPFPYSEICASYKKIGRRIGISGKCNDDLHQYFGVDDYSMKPLEMDELHTYLLRQYELNRSKIRALGVDIGRSRVAAISEDLNGRLACNYSGNCLWGCYRKSLYSALDDIISLRKNSNFHEASGVYIDKVVSDGDLRLVYGKSVISGQNLKYSAKYIVLAAGTLATTRLVLNAIGRKTPIRLLTSPNAAFMVAFPKKIALQRQSGFALGQISHVIRLSSGINAFGSTFSTVGIPVSEFLKFLPLRKRFAVDLLRILLNSCLVGNIFLPGSFSNVTVRSQLDGSLKIENGNNNQTELIFKDIRIKIQKMFWIMGGILLPGSFIIGRPGSDIHYSGTLPMKANPALGETSESGEVCGMKGVYVVDGACLPFLSEKSHTLTIMANADRIANKLVKKIIQKN